MGIGKWLSDKVAGVSDEVQLLAKRFADKQTAEAVVAIMTGTAHADGELEEAERKKLVLAFDKHPVLSVFDKSVLTRKFADLSDAFLLDTDEGLARCLDELDDIANADEAKRAAVMRMGVASAKADGELESTERAFLIKAAKRLYLEPADFGL